MFVTPVTKWCNLYPALHGERPYVDGLKAIELPGRSVGMRQFLQFRSELRLVRIFSNWMPAALLCILYSSCLA